MPSPSRTLRSMTTVICHEMEHVRQFSEGFRYVFVNGKPAVYRGKPTGALAGKAVVHSAESAK